MTQLHIARQPIVDAHREVYGYELLFRGAGPGPDGGAGDDLATAEVLVGAFMDLGVARLVGPHRAFVNVGPGFVARGEAEGLPPARVVLELLEHSQPTDRLLEGLARLRHAGFSIALDDYAGQAHLQPFLDQVDWVKVDLTLVEASRLEAVLAQLPDRLTLLAEKVETAAQFEHCRALGFHYFQGFFFARPQVVSGRRPRPNRLALVRLLAVLHDPQVQVRDLEALLAQEPALGARVLRYVNAPCFGLGRPVASLHQAILVMGLRTLRNWVTLVVMAGLEDKPRELVKLAMVRARTAQCWARAMGQDADAAFTVGLFSLLDAFLDLPLPQALAELPLDPSVQAALLRHEGPLGRLLEGIEAYEQGRWSVLERWPEPARLALREAYLEAIAWADENVAALA